MGSRWKSSPAASALPGPTGDSPPSLQHAKKLDLSFSRQLLPPPLLRQTSQDRAGEAEFDGESEAVLDAAEFELPVTRALPLPPVLGQTGPPTRAASSSTRANQLVIAPFELSRIMTRNRRSSERPVASTSSMPPRFSRPSGSSASDSGDLSDGDPPGYVPPAPAVALSRSTSEGGSKDKGKRTFEELEDITFSNPKQFTSMAVTIAG